MYMKLICQLFQHHTSVFIPCKSKRKEAIMDEELAAISAIYCGEEEVKILQKGK